MVESKESSPSLSSEEDDFSHLGSDDSARISSDSPSFEVIDETEIPETAELEATAAMPSMVTEEKSDDLNDEKEDFTVPSQSSSLDFANESLNTVILTSDSREEQVFNQPAVHIEQMANGDTQPEPVVPIADEQSSKNNQKAAPQNTKKYIVAASALAITGIALGVAVAVYLEMLAIGIAVAVCCFIAATITYCVRPKSLVEVKKVMQTEECLSK